MNKRYWDENKIALLKALSENPGLTQPDIAKKMNTTLDAVDHAQRRYGIKQVTAPKEAPENLKYVETYAGMVAYLKEELSKTKPYELVRPSSKKSGDTLNVHLSDWHVGRIIKNEYGKIIYDVNTFKSMIETFEIELLKLVDKYISKGTPITDVKILSTGDILDGMGIFASQETVSELAPPFQVILATQTIQKLILAFLDRKLQVQFYGTNGNHGSIRLNGKSTDFNANWDLMLYLMLELWTKTDKRAKNVQVHYSELEYLNFVNRGWNYHLRHIAPNQSETSAGKAKFLGWAKRHNFDLLVYGHYHHWGAWDRSKITVIRGGALTASDEFAETLAEESEPVQLVWGCNEHRPLTFLYPLDLGQKEKRK
jgi:predicted phosphodiesterase